MNKFTGKVLKLGDDISSDVILPARYSMLTDPKELASHALEEMARDMPARVVQSQVIVAGRNFGLGTGREASVTCLRHAGIRVIIARSFARIFFRNAINHGIVILDWTQEEPFSSLKDGDVVTVDMEASKISAAGQEVPFKPFPRMIRNILEAGGIVPYGKKIFVDQRKGG